MLNNYKMNSILTCLLAFTIFTTIISPVQAMHIMEGFLPPSFCIVWGILCIPFLACGITKINRLVARHPQAITFLAMAGAFTFVLSALKLPSLTGSSSHMTGLGFAAILFGPSVASVLSVIVLLFQAVLLAHGGLTTLGANTFSMGIVGTVTAFLVYYSLQKTIHAKSVAIFFAAFLGDLVTYVTTSLQLALAHPSEVGGVTASFIKFAGIFAITQIPLAVVEGILTVVLFNIITAYAQDTIKPFGEHYL
ncbi:MAG: energy-coupling factor ABC transporter permease [Planctomycetaceae bacterium]|jgi:cobalt/nickel transport system permease protein|nr:energy-coupling factor ABC transporter permease [Planctomycetaceae bacterium]